MYPYPKSIPPSNLHPYPNHNPNRNNPTPKQQRGVEISADAWKGALNHAEQLVVLAEKKLERQRVKFVHRVNKLKVSIWSFIVLVCSVISSRFTSRRNKKRHQNETR